MKWLRVIRGARGLAWVAASIVAVIECQDLRYALMHQDTAFQQDVLASITVCRLLTLLVIALGADRAFELGERTLREKLASPSDLDRDPGP